MARARKRRAGSAPDPPPVWGGSKDTRAALQQHPARLRGPGIPPMPLELQKKCLEDSPTGLRDSGHVVPSVEVAAEGHFLIAHPPGPRQQATPGRLPAPTSADKGVPVELEPRCVVGRPSRLILGLGGEKSAERRREGGGGAPDTACPGGAPGAAVLPFPK